MTLLLNPHSTIGNIKNKLKEVDIISENEGLFYNNKELADNIVLSNIDIDKESTIEIREKIKDEKEKTEKN
ncbi:MAG: hypothetical protein QMD06_03480 [Candidatus Altarchaeum sp.]|nr:hypothetical protein [Candidatus Altarchaeum sp.]